MQQNSRGATEQRSGKRKSIGKRKFSEQEEVSHQPQHQQATISELLSRNHTAHGKEHHPQPSSPTSKRPRLSPTPSSPTSAQGLRGPASSNIMYNFSNQEPKASGSFGQVIPGTSHNATTRPRSFNAPVRQSNFTPHTGAKKLVVKNLRTGSQLNQDSYFEKIWGQLDTALTAIFNGGKPAVSLEELYKGAENVCRQGRASALARQLQERCRGHVSGKLRDMLVAKAAGGDNIDTLRAVVESWTTWQSKLVCRGSLYTQIFARN
jgi:hypothetical protein